MSLAHGNRPIVTDGLVLCLDAANPRSYPGTGTTWNDLSGNENHGTLVNGVGYSSDNNGSLVFDGVDDYSVVPVPTLSNSELTINVFVKPLVASGLNNTEVVINKHYANNRWNFRISIGDFSINNSTLLRSGVRQQSGEDYAVNGPELNLNQWYNIVFTIKEFDFVKLYLDGDLIGQTFMPVSMPPNITDDIYIAASDLSLDGARWDAGIELPLVQLYNRALTADEVAQNFNAMRGRYGI